MSPYYDNNWDNPYILWQSERDALLDYYRVQSHAIENDRLDHKETKPLDSLVHTEQDYWLLEQDLEDWWAWDMYFENTFSQTLRTSVVTLLCARLTEWTSHFCEYMRARLRTASSYRDIRKKGWHLDGHLRYLILIHSCSIRVDHNAVIDTQRYFTLRNAIMHERHDAGAITQLRDWPEVSCVNNQILLADTCVNTCGVVFTGFVDYLMGVCSDVLKS